MSLYDHQGMQAGPPLLAQNHGLNAAQIAAVLAKLTGQGLQPPVAAGGAAKPQGDGAPPLPQGVDKAVVQPTVIQQPQDEVARNLELEGE